MNLQRTLKDRTKQKEKNSDLFGMLMEQNVKI